MTATGQTFLSTLYIEHCGTIKESFFLYKNNDQSNVTSKVEHPLPRSDRVNLENFDETRNEAKSFVRLYHVAPVFY